MSVSPGKFLQGTVLRVPANRVASALQKHKAERREKGVDRFSIRSDAPRVFYGWDSLSSGHETISGGLVKCLDLDRVWPNAVTDATILYLVSSALPPAAEVMVREAKRKGVPVVWNQNGVAYPAWFGPGHAQSNNIMKRLMPFADHVLYQSEFCRMCALKWLDVSPRRWSVCHNPVDTDMFTPGPKSARSSLAPKILLAGSHHEQYRVYRALETVARLYHTFPEVHLTVAGKYHWSDSHEKARKEGQERASELGISDRVTFSGPYTQMECVELMKGHDLLLHTKVNDPCPRLVVEAMACGLPIVFSRTGGLPELIPERCGFGVPGTLDWMMEHPPNAEDLARGVEGVVQEYDRFSKNARMHAVDHLDVKPWIETHRQLFSTLISGRVL